jgi:hypothetical protein
MGDELILPATIARELEVEGAFDRDPTCPAATAGHYADSHRKHVRCGVEEAHFAVADSPMAAAAFCFGDYTTCPVWTREKDGELDALRAKLRARATARLTERQIATGLRVDDSDDPHGEASAA